jgi:D-tyrosyl-tRNA(Tyr) deacylase
LRVVLQRVKRASVSVDGKLIASIGRGLVVFLGICKEDSDNDINYLSEKVLGARIFPNGDKETSVSVKDINGEILLVSQFTLFGDMRKGKRPSFSDAMSPEEALIMFDKFADTLSQKGGKVKTGVFQAMMDIELVNDGPYTILIDSKKKF